MERYLITVEEFRKNQKKIDAMNREEAISLANKLFPSIMKSINEMLCSQTGSGIMFHVDKLISGFNTDTVLDSIWNHQTFKDEIVRLLTEQLNDIRDFKCSYGSDMVSIIASD